MAEVFLSYAQEDVGHLRPVIDELRRWNASAWFDQYILGGEDYREVIEREIAQAKVVFVLWTPHSIKSRFVRDEADEAVITGKYVGLLCGVGPREVPMGFRQFQAVQHDDATGLRSAMQKHGRIIEESSKHAIVATMPEKAREEIAWSAVQEVTRCRIDGENALSDTEKQEFDERLARMMTIFATEYPESKRTAAILAAGSAALGAATAGSSAAIAALAGVFGVAVAPSLPAIAAAAGAMTLVSAGWSYFKAKRNKGTK